ncbi:SHD1 domain-containing protein, partial [Pirellulales bacterium]|nr:SHD1 domain-containing protein [Pirellulales bacterium]
DDAVLRGIAPFDPRSGGGEGTRRIWVDATGEHKVDAEFVELAGGKVRLRRADGRIIALPLDKLSPADQDEARRLAAGPGAARDASDPFGDSAVEEPAADRPAPVRRKPQRQEGDFLPGDIVEAKRWGKVKEGKVLGGDEHWLKILFDGETDVDTVSRRDKTLRMVRADPNAVPRSEAGQALTTPDMSNVRHVVLGGSPAAAFQPDGLDAAQSPQRVRAVGVGPQRGFFEDIESFSVSPAGRYAVIARAGGAGVHDDAARIQICDLVAGRTRNLDVKHKFMATRISPSGDRLATVTDDAESAVDVWDIRGELEHAASWEPSGGGHFNDVIDMAWLDDNRLLTVSRKAILAWDVTNVRAEYQLQLDRLDAGVLSPGGKQLAISTAGKILVLEAATGDLLQSIVTPESRTHQGLAFDPSGRLLAALRGSQLDLINVETGEAFDSLYVPYTGNSVSWADEEHVLVGGRHLVHVPSQMPVWEYPHSAAQVAHAAGWNWYLFSGHNAQGALIPLRLPHKGVSNVTDDQLVLRPGDSVRLEVELINDFAAGGRSILQDARDKLTQDLENAGYVVASEAPAVLVAQTMPGERREIQYRNFGITRGEPDKVSETERVYLLELKINGEVVWTRRQVQGPPHFLQMEQGETVQQAVARVMEPTAGYFGSGIPDRILDPEQAKRRVSE